VRRGQVEEYDQLEYRVIDMGRGLPEFFGFFGFERTDGRCRVMISEKRVVRLD